MASGKYTKLYSVGTTAIQILGRSEARVAIIIGQPAGGRITVAAENNVTDGNGIVVQMGDPPLQLRRCDYGCLVSGPLYAIADGAARTGAIIEIEGEKVSQENDYRYPPASD